MSRRMSFRTEPWADATEEMERAMAAQAMPAEGLLLAEHAVEPPARAGAGDGGGEGGPAASSAGQVAQPPARAGATNRAAQDAEPPARAGATTQAAPAPAWLARKAKARARSNSRPSFGVVDVFFFDPAEPAATPPTTPRPRAAGAASSSGAAAASSSGAASSSQAPGASWVADSSGEAPGASWVGGDPGRGRWNPEEWRTAGLADVPATVLADDGRWHYKHGQWWFKGVGQGPDGGSDCPRADPARAARNEARKQQKLRSQARRAAEDAADPDGAAAREFERCVNRRRAEIAHTRKSGVFIDPADL